MYGFFPVHMRGFDESGSGFEANSLVDNISSGGLYVQLARRIAEGSKMFAIVQLENGASVAARGVVIRIEQRSHGLFGVALRFMHAKLIQARPRL